MTRPAAHGSTDQPSTDQRKEHPLLFAPPMARALAERRKLETRRLIKADGRLKAWAGSDLVARLDAHGRPLYQGAVRPPAELAPIQPGDVIRPRESWRPHSWHEDFEAVIEYRAGGLRTLPDPETPEQEDWLERMLDAAIRECEAADCDVDDSGAFIFPDAGNPCRWRSGLFLPHWAARCRLPVVSVRAERVQEITDEAVEREGVDYKDRGPGFACWRMAREMRRRNTPIQAFTDYWNHLHGPGAWAMNDWVWV